MTRAKKEDALRYHNQLEPGKIEVTSSKPLGTMKQLSLAYTPGVAYPCLEIKDDPSKAYDYTMKGNTIAILTDGSRVLGLGDIGPLAGLPVMEGKALLFKVLGDVNAFPICLRAKDTEEIVETMKKLEPAFGGVNIEDIKPPRCFEVLEHLREKLSIPIFHDDQHGTGVVVLAALINALNVVNKELNEIYVIVNGAGSAGIGIAKLLVSAGVYDIVVLDTKGAIHKERTDLTHYKWEIAHLTNKEQRKGDLTTLVKRADVFIGASSPGVLTRAHVRQMNTNPIIFALANPIPEITPAEAKRAGAAVVGTGSSEYENQVNNVLAFPGIMRGVLDCRARVINREMRLAAAYAIAALVKEPTPRRVIPKPLDAGVAPAVARAVAEAADKTGVAHKKIQDLNEYERAVAQRIRRHRVFR